MDGADSRRCENGVSRLGQNIVNNPGEHGFGCAPRIYFWSSKSIQTRATLHRLVLLKASLTSSLYENLLHGDMWNCDG